MRVYECFKWQIDMCTSILSSWWYCRGPFQPCRKAKSKNHPHFKPKLSCPHLNQSVSKSVLYTGGFPVLSFCKIKLMKRSLYSNMKETPSVNTGKMLPFFSPVSRFFKKGESWREHLMTDVTFLPSGLMCSSWMVLPTGHVIPTPACPCDSL